MKSKIDINELKAQFDKVLLKHTKGENGFGGHTEALLIVGDNVFGGNARCSKDEQFNRARGRQIALDRALHAFEVATKGKHPRKRSLKNYSSFYGRLVYTKEGEKPTVLAEQRV